MKTTIFFICLFMSWASLTSFVRAELSLFEKLALLQQSYPNHIKKVDGNNLVLSNGQVILIDDGKQKTHGKKLRTADIEDMLSQVYPIGPCDRRKLPRNFDPGRIRNEILFRHIYGGSSREVAKTLAPIKWFGARVSFTRTNKAHQALQKVRDELAKYSDLKKYLAPSAGTFKWRKIAGTDRLSFHSFAAAIDLNIKYSHYWRWSGGKAGNVKYVASRIPQKVVEIFEKHGFIWGGKWYHYDTMHFEYRPELIAIGNKSKGKC